MTDLLLITDMPRVRKIFNRLSDDKGITLRMASSLEKGVEELVARKPAMVFVQTHLSGLSADILLMHLKKQLGRKRSRFILLSAPSQVSDDAIKLYHGHIDTSLDDKEILDTIRDTVAAPTTRKGKNVQEAAQEADDIVVEPGIAQAQPTEAQGAAPGGEPKQALLPAPNIPDILTIAGPPAAPAEPSLEDQGITYARSARVKGVYSEFTSSFDSAVESMQEPEPLQEPAGNTFPGWDTEHLEPTKADKRISERFSASKRFSFLLWLAPVVVAAVVVAAIQSRKPAQQPVADITVNPPQQAKPLPQQAAPVQPQAVSQPKQPVSPAPPARTDKMAATQLSDKAVISDIAGERKHVETPGPAKASARPSALPDFIPTYGKDKKYSAANPGWERYKGAVTEFKVFRDKGAIKAIQVIDRGGQGVPESFMKASLRQLAKKPAFILESTEKKDGYEIQHGRTADNLKVVFYRDEHGGRLRAFVVNWQ